MEMGELVCIVDLVCDMICLFGFSIDEVKIEIIGFCFGEKLYEEFLVDNEVMLLIFYLKFRIVKLECMLDFVWLVEIEVWLIGLMCG